METRKKEALKIVGLSVETLNAPGRAENEIPGLWMKFMEANLIEKVTNRISDDIYAVYCKYEGDHLAPYTTLIGYAIPTDEATPSGLTEIAIPESNYSVFKAEGDLTDKAVLNTWNTIWNTDLNRNYIADFEIYGDEASNPKDGKIDIFVGIK